MRTGRRQPSASYRERSQEKPTVEQFQGWNFFFLECLVELDGKPSGTVLLWEGFNIVVSLMVMCLFFTHCFGHLWAFQPGNA